MSDEDREGESTNPVLRCQEDVDSQNAEDDREIYVIMEDKRQEFCGNSSLPRCAIADLKAWWKKSAQLEHLRDPETGMLLDAAAQGKVKKPKKKLTGEELFKTDPTLFQIGADGQAVKMDDVDIELEHAFAAFEGTKKEAAISAKKGTEGDEGEVEGGEGVDDDDGEEGIVQEEEFQAGRTWGNMEIEEDIDEVEDDDEEEEEKEDKQPPSPAPAKFNPSPRAKAKVDMAAIGAAVDDLPDNLDELDDD